MNDSAYSNANPLQRQLSHLKVLSRLLGHELHTQTGGQSINLSREAVTEMQTSIDLFIEEATKFTGNSYSAGGSGAPNPNRAATTSLGDANLVPTRN